MFDTPVGYTQTLPNEVCVSDPGDAKDSDCGSTDTCTTLTSTTLMISPSTAAMYRSARVRLGIVPGLIRMRMAARTPMSLALRV